MLRKMMLRCGCYDDDARRNETEYVGNEIHRFTPSSNKKRTDVCDRSPTRNQIKRVNPRQTNVNARSNDAIKETTIIYRQGVIKWEYQL